MNVGVCGCERAGWAEQQYFHQHNKQISTPALAQMLSNTLYYKRFFPYYSFNILGGLDEQGAASKLPSDARHRAAWALMSGKPPVCFLFSFPCPFFGGRAFAGRGAVYHFDVVGSFQRERYRADGTAQELIQPLLDSQVGLKNQVNPDTTPIPLEKAVKMVRDAFNVATERDIYTGDAVEIHIITRDGVRVELHELRKD